MRGTSGESRALRCEALNRGRFLLGGGFDRFSPIAAPGRDRGGLTDHFVDWTNPRNARLGLEAFEEATVIGHDLRGHGIRIDRLR